MWSAAALGGRFAAVARHAPTISAVVLLISGGFAIGAAVYGYNPPGAAQR